MRSLWIILTSFLLFTMTGCNYETDQSKMIQSISPDEYVKNVANEFFSADNLDTIPFKNINNTIAFLAKSYAAFPSSVTGKPSIYLLLQDFKAIMAGDINVLTTIVNGFKNEQGVYEANTDSQKWVRKGNANDSIVMYFKDQYQQDRQAIMAWYNTLGAPLPITLIRKGGTVKMELPNKIMLQIRNLSAANDSTMTINLTVIPNQTFTQVNMTADATFLDYNLQMNTAVKDTAMHITASLKRSEREIAKYNLDGNGTNLLKGAIDKVDYAIVLGAYNSKLVILDKLYTTNNVKDANTLKEYLLSNYGTGTYDYMKNICDIVNKNMYFRVWNSSGNLLCSATMYPVKIKGAYTGAPYINWIYGDSQDLSDFSSEGIKNTVSRLQEIINYLSNLLGSNS